MISVRALNLAGVKETDVSEEDELSIVVEERATLLYKL